MPFKQHWATDQRRVASIDDKFEAPSAASFHEMDEAEDDSEHAENELGQNWLSKVVNADEEEREDRQRLLAAVEEELFAPADTQSSQPVKSGYKDGCDPARVPGIFLSHDSQMPVE